MSENVNTKNTKHYKKLRNTGEAPNLKTKVKMAQSSLPCQTKNIIEQL